MVSPADLRHLRPVKALPFPASDPEWEMSESKRHARMCELLYLVLRHALGDGHSVGSDQFVYFDASNPQRKCAPDAFVKLGVPDTLFDSWKVWERDRGTPDLCVEILSPSDTREKLTWEEKLERYFALGARELVAFDADAPVGARLRAWDRIDDDLVEREIVGESTPCATLGAHWVIVPSREPGGEDLPAALRLARDPRGAELVPTGPEAEKAAAEADKAAAEADKAAAEAENARLRTELEAARR
jgi:hypothetical protein